MVVQIKLIVVVVVASRTFKEKSVFVTLLLRYCFGSFHFSHETTRYLKRSIRGTCEAKKDGVLLCNSEKDLHKVNSTVV